jgi:hypothetical protein
MLRRRRADDRADVRQAVAAPLRAEAVDERGDVLPHRLPRAERGVLEVGRARVRGPDEHEQPAAGGGERRERVLAEVRVDRQGVGVDPGHRAERRVRAAEERLRVGLGGDADVAALGVGDDEQAGGARSAGHALERGPAGRAEALEAGDLRLDRDAGGRRRGDQRRAVRDDDLGRALGGAAVAGVGGQGLRPHPRGVGIEPEDDLRLALADACCEPGGEALVRDGRSGCHSI